MRKTFDDFWMWVPGHVESDQWYHVCIIYKEGKAWKYFVNGKEEK